MNIMVQILSNEHAVIENTYEIHLAAFIYGRHLPDVPGMDKADWLAKELRENGGYFETGTGCVDGHTVRFSEVIE